MRIVDVHNLYIVLFLKHVNNKKRLKEKLHLINSQKKEEDKTWIFVNMWHSKNLYFDVLQFFPFIYKMVLLWQH